MSQDNYVTSTLRGRNNYFLLFFYLSFLQKLFLTFFEIFEIALVKPFFLSSFKEFPICAIKVVVKSFY